MDLTKLSRVSDSQFGEQADARKKRQKDAARKSLKSRLHRKIMDTEDTEGVIEAAKEELANSSPEEVLETTVEILDEVVEQLTEQVEDSKRKNKKTKKSDSLTRLKFKKKLMDTEDTESAISVALEELETTDPATVVETVIEVLDNVIENLSNE